MAHNAAFYQQPPQSQPAMYAPQPAHQQQQIPPQHTPAPPQNIYQQMGIQQPQPGQARPRAYQDPQYQRNTTMAVRDFWQQKQQQQQPPQQPLYGQQAIPQPSQSYMQPQIQSPPTPLPPGQIPLQPQHTPASHPAPNYQPQYQPQSSYTPAPYQASITPQPQHPAHQTHSHSHSVPNLPYAPSVPHHPQSNPIPPSPHPQSQISTAASTPHVPSHQAAANQPGQPIPGRRPLPQLTHQRSDSLPAGATIPDPAARPRSQYSSFQHGATSTTHQRSGPPASEPPQDRNLPARGMARTRSETTPVPSSILESSSSQFSTPSASRITSSFSAGVARTAAEVPMPGAKTPATNGRPLPPSPGGDPSRAVRHQSIDFSGSAGSKPNSMSSLSALRSASPPKFSRDTGDNTSRSGSMSPTKRDPSPVKQTVPGTVPTPFTQMPGDVNSAHYRRRASPPRWAGSDSSRSTSPTKPPSSAMAPSSKVSSPPSPTKSASAFPGSAPPNSNSSNASFSAARSVFSKSSDASPSPVSRALNSSPTKPGPPSQPPSPPKPKAPPVWKRTIPDRGDASKIDFIGRNTFNPSVYIDPPFPGTAAYARNVALANAGGLPGYAGRPPVGYRASIAGPPVGYTPYAAPPAGYAAYPAQPPVAQRSPQRYSNEQDEDEETEDDSEEESEEDDGESAESGREKKGKAKAKSKGKAKGKEKEKGGGKGDKAKDKSSRSDRSSGDRTPKSKAKTARQSGPAKAKSRHRRGDYSDDEDESVASESARGPSDSEVDDYDDQSGTGDEENVRARKRAHAKQVSLREKEKERQREREREIEREVQREIEREIEREKEREREREREREEWERQRREREEWERERREREEWEREREKREREEWEREREKEREKERERREREEWERQKEKEKQREREEWERQKQREREEWEQEKQREIERERERLEKEKERELKEKERQLAKEREEREREREKERERLREWEREQERRQRDRSGSSPQFGSRDPPSGSRVRGHSPTYSMPSNGNASGLPRPPPMVRDTGYRGESDFGHRHGRSQGGSDRQRLYGLDLNLDDEPPPSLRRSPSPSSPTPSNSSSAFGGGFRSKAHYQEPEKPSWTQRKPAPQLPPQPQQQSWTQRQAPQQLPQSQTAKFAQQSPTRFSPRKNQTQSLPSINIIESPSPIGGREKMADIPKIAFEGVVADDDDDEPPHRGPSINIQSFDDDPPARGRNTAPTAPKVQVFEVPGISFSGPDDSNGPIIAISGPDDEDGNRSRHQIAPKSQRQPIQRQQIQQIPAPARRGTGGGLICGGCGGPIAGRIVSAMNLRWHPDCFRCAVCSELLEHVSSYEHDGRPYCHLDYHENFAPRCYHCKTAIIEERFISLDDPALGKRNYHEQHFFCAECGDPFLPPTISGSAFSKSGELSLSGDGQFESDDVAFTVYKGHPYCENCHVRLRMPKCKRCKRSIRDGDEAVEALGGKWCWSCFVCASCEKPFDDPAFFERGGQPYCEPCFSVMLRNEI